MDLLKKLLVIQSPSNKEDRMIRFLTRYCKSLGCRVWVKRKNVYVVKGESDCYPCLVAHTDTVFEFIAQDHLQIRYHNDLIFGCNKKSQTFTGLGMDDKIGIWIALKMLQENDSLKCFFPHAEEEGAIGSAKADMSFFKDVAYCIQCDRRGNDEIVTNIGGRQICGDEFLKDITSLMEKHDYKPATGMLTDVYQLVKNGIGRSCVNISAGYYNPHRMDEFIVVTDVIKALNFVRSMLKTLGNTIYRLPKHDDHNLRQSFIAKYGLPANFASSNDPWVFHDNCRGCGTHAAIVEEYYTLCEECYNLYYADLFFTHDRMNHRCVKESRETIT